MGSSSVLLIATEPNAATDIVAGSAVLSSTWRQAAQALNHVLGRGAVVVPYHNPRTGPVTIIPTTCYYWVHPRPQALERVWVLKVVSAGTPYTLRVNGVIAASIGQHNGTTVTYYYRESLSAQSELGSQNEVRLSNNGAGSSSSLRGVACYDVPRVALREALPDCGIYVPDLESGQRVKHEHVRKLMYALDGSDFAIGAKTYINWSCGGATLGPATTTASTSFVDVFTDGMPILARKMYRSDTSRQVVVKIYAYVDAGTGEVRVSTTSGGTYTAISVTSTTGAWHESIVDVDCTDTDSADSRQTAASPAWDSLQVQMRHTTGGANEIYVGSVAAFDKPFDPNDFSPTFWLRSDLEVTTSSGLITDWADQSSNAEDFTQATAADRPGYATALNGEYAAVFNGAKHLGSSSSITLPTNYCLWMVGKIRSSAAEKVIWSDGSGTELGKINTDGTFDFVCGATTTTTAEPVTDRVVTIMLDATAYPDATCYVDNVSVGTISGVDSSPNTGTFYIGSDTAGANEAEFELYEMALFDSANVGTNGRAQLQAYARRRYYDEDFTPLDLRPEIWVRGDLGASVSAWLDQSGNGRNFSQATVGNQPALETGACGQVGFRFTSTDVFASDATYTPPSTYVVWAVAEQETDTDASGYIWQGPNSANDAGRISYRAPNNFFRATIGGVAALDSTTPINGRGPMAFAAIASGASAKSLEVNNTEEDTSATAVTSVAGTIYLGNAVTGTAAWTGIIYEYAIFDYSKMTAGDFDTLWAYAFRRYGISDGSETLVIMTDTDGTPLLDTDGSYLRDA